MAQSPSKSLWETTAETFGQFWAAPSTLKAESTAKCFNYSSEDELSSSHCKSSLAPQKDLSSNSRITEHGHSVATNKRSLVNMEFPSKAEYLEPDAGFSSDDYHFRNASLQDSRDTFLGRIMDRKKSRKLSEEASDEIQNHKPELGVVRRSARNQKNQDYSNTSSARNRQIFQNQTAEHFGSTREFKILGASNETWMNSKKSLKRDKPSTDSVSQPYANTNQDHEAVIRQLSEQLDQERHEVHLLRDEAHTEKRRLRELELHNTVLKQEIAASRRERNDISDTEISQKMADLCDEVFDWIHGMLSDNSLVSPIIFQNNRPSLSNNALQLLQSGQIAIPVILQAVIWKTMCSVFKPRFRFGHSKKGMVNLVSKVVVALNIEEKLMTNDQKEWLRKTSALLQVHAKEDVDAMLQLKKIVQSVIEDDLKLFTKNLPSKGQREWLSCIIDKATDLARDLWEQKTSYAVNMPFHAKVVDCSMKFKSSMMDSMEENHARQVTDETQLDCFLTPVLLKRREPKGNDTQDWIVLRKATVLCAIDDHDQNQASKV